MKANPGIANSGTKCIPVRSGLALAAACTLSSGLFSASVGAEWLVEPELSLDTQHSSNFQLIIDSASEDSLLSSTVTGGLSVSQRTENFQIDGRIELGYTNFSGARILEDVDRQYLDFRFSRTLERLSFGLGLSVRRDDLVRFISSSSDPDAPLADGFDEFDQEFVDPNADLNVSTDQINRTVSSYRAFSNYRLTELNSLRLSYSFVERDLDSTDELEANGILPRKTTRHEVGLGLTRRISPRTRISWDNRVSRIKTAELNSVDLFESTFGWSSRIGPQTRLAASVGANRTSGASRNRTGLVARAQLSHRVSWGTIEAQAVRNIRPTIQGNLNEVDSVRLSFTRPLAPKWNLILEASGNQRRRSTDLIIDNRIRRFRVGPTISWSFAPSWAVSAGYQYSYIDRDQSFAEGTGFDHAGVLSINYQPSGTRL